MTKRQWIAIARDALIRANVRPSTAELAIKLSTKVRLKEKEMSVAYGHLNHLEFQEESGKC